MQVQPKMEFGITTVVVVSKYQVWVDKNSTVGFARPGSSRT